jgi:hypothetical protein
MARKGIALTVGPHQFDSIRACAKFFGRSSPNVRYHLARGTLDSLLDTPKLHDGTAVETPVRGTVYPTMRAAATALGVTLAAVSRAHERGTLDSLGAYQVFQ